MKNNIVQRIFNKIHSTILDLMDEASDKKVCGQSLVKYVKSVYRDDANGVGMTGSQSTRYIILERIFSHVTLTEQDNFIDIGCGKGRVLAYLIKAKAPCSLNGIEINEIAYNVAQDWAKKYDQVNVMFGDAFKLDYNPYTVLFMGRPFLPVTFKQFIEAFEAGLDHPITLIYWVDQQSGYLLNDRPGWKMLYREKLKYIKGLKVARSPQGYSIWTYDPSLR